jgi:hypothetical protein
MKSCGGSQIYVVKVANHPAHVSLDELKEAIPTVSNQDTTPNLQNSIPVIFPMCEQLCFPLNLKFFKCSVPA